VQLAKKQSDVFGRVIEWARGHFGVDLKVSSSLYGSEQEPEVPLAYADYMNKLPYAQLLALTELAGACKSLLIAFAVSEKQLTVAQVRIVCVVDADTAAVDAKPVHRAPIMHRVHCG
jgi:chaperone required for assembly of F1-ATPase